MGGSWKLFPWGRVELSQWTWLLGVPMKQTAVDSASPTPPFLAMSSHSLGTTLRLCGHLGPPPTCPCAHPGGAAAPTALPGPMLRRCSRASGCGQPLPYLLIRVSTPPPAASWGWGLPVSPCREVLLAVLSPRTEPTGQRLPFAVSTELKIDAFQCLAVCWCRCIFSLACFFFLLFVNTLFI